jgi:hypothetical protein
MDAEGYTKMILDKTLADYIKRAQEQMQSQYTQPVTQENYKVYPEDDGTDRPIIPYGDH